MTVRLVATALAVILVSGCGKGKEESSQQQQQPQVADPQAVQQAARNQLNGTWQSNCIEGRGYAITAKADLGITQRTKVLINETNLTEVATISSLACDSNDIEITSTGQFESKETSKPEVKGMNLKITSYRVKPLTEFGVRVLNISKWCGISDWAVEQERDVTPEVGKEKCFTRQSLNTIYSLENDNLFFGNTDNMSSSSEPPAELTKIFYFKRL